ncbi:hypothetical protein MRX96_054157 [Rhipicephalus microplus]
MPPTAPLRLRLSHSGQKLVKSFCWSSKTRCLRKLQHHEGPHCSSRLSEEVACCWNNQHRPKPLIFRSPPLLQQQHVLANGQPPPDPDSIPLLEPITAEEHFHAEMLHQTIKQTALLQDMLSAQQRIAQAAERQAQAAEEQSHALSQLALFLIENHRSNKNSGANLSSSGVDDCSCSESATTLSITPEILQVEHST